MNAWNCICVIFIVSYQNITYLIIGFFIYLIFQVSEYERRLQTHQEETSSVKKQLEDKDSIIKQHQQGINTTVFFFCFFVFFSNLNLEYVIAIICDSLSQNEHNVATLHFNIITNS